MAIEMSSPWIAGPVGAAAGAALAWIATEYKTRKTYRNVIMLLAKSADDFAGAGQVEKALSIYDQILKDVPRLEPAVRGEVRFRQGLSYYGQSFEGARDTNLRRAVEAFEEAIKLYKPARHPVEHAQAQNGLGMSLVRLSEASGAWAFGRSDRSDQAEGGEEEGSGANLKRAVLAFEEALKLYAAQGRDQEHAQTENNLGDAYILLSKLDGPKAAEDLQKAIAAYKEALKFRTAAEHPEDYAETKNSLGRALISLAQLEEGVGEGEGETEMEVREAHLDEAISSFKAALEVRTTDAHPEERAETQTLLGQALVLESEPSVSGSEIRWSDREGLKMAIEAYEEALAVRTRESHPLEYAETKNLLGRALVILSGPASGPEDAANLKRAIRAFEEALTIRTLEASPRDYAETQNNLGIAYRNLSKLEDREENLERSIRAYEEALGARSGGAKKKEKKKASESAGGEMAGRERADEEIEGIGGFGGLGLE